MKLSTPSFSAASVLVAFLLSCSTPPPPAPLEPIPSPQQVDWQQMEFYMFVHFNMNTFNNMEWGYGDEPATSFNPSELDTRQWARVAKEAGMTGIILTAKHHDGFCLWPSEYTEYSVKNSNWKNGEGDVLRELREACDEYGLKMGVYLSPWDRNHADYGKPEYLTYFRNQLRELLTNYGDIYEVWFDGANGGDGYYGGANETRRVDKQTYYDWPNTISIVRELMPKAIVFSDAGPDCRWVGNESGLAAPTTWSPLMRDEVYPGMPEYARQYAKGQPDGTHWVPAETDVSIRPGWYYHPNEDDKVKSLKQLLDIYYWSVGRNTTLLLNFPVDRRGLVHESDVRQVQKLREQLDLDFAEDLAAGKRVRSDQVRGRGYSAKMVTDGDPETYWSTADGVKSASLTIDLGAPTTFNRFLAQEYIPLGQRVKQFDLEVQVDGEWQPLDKQTTIGYKRILRFDEVTASKVRLNILDARASPTISNIQLFHAPLVVDAPAIVRDKEGRVTLEVPEEGVQLYYSMDGTAPDLSAEKYSGALRVHQPTTVKAIAYDPATERLSEVATRSFDISKRQWEALEAEDDSPIDDDPWTNFVLPNQQLTIDLGERLSMRGFTYTPDQSRYARGVITQYSFQVSSNGSDWRTVSQGEFANVQNNPIEQEIRFDEVEARFVRLAANQVAGEQAVVAELGIVTR